MRICIDIDGVICRLKENNQHYSDVLPIDGAPEKIRELKNAGHYIILHTARRMKTHNGNLGKVISDIGKDTIDWLKKHDVPYDEIYFGKPWANLYIDDNGFRFNNWDDLDGSGNNLPKYNGIKLKK